MFVENIRQFQTIIDSECDEMAVIKKIIANLKNLLKIDIVIADKNNKGLFGAAFKSENYFYKIPIKAMNVKYGMIYVNGIDKLSQGDLAYFYSTIPLISLLMKNIYCAIENNIKNQIRSAKVVISSLSTSEFLALKYVFEKLEGNGGIIVISEIAKKANITRSIIVNAIKKIESAGIVDSRSLGMKGTKIDIKNKYFRLELKDC